MTTPVATLIDVQRIWYGGAHNAFTDLLRWHGRWHCICREGDDHIGGDGCLRLLRSDDGARWMPLALIEEAGVDLRDPKLSVTPSDQLMVVAGGSIYDGTTLRARQSRVFFSSDGEAWSAPVPVLDQGEWLWRVTWVAEIAYGVSYNPSTEPDWTVTLVRSGDGCGWETVTRLAVPGRPNETTLRALDDGEMLALVRREGGDRHGWLGRSRAPYGTWTWTSVGHRLGGPNFIALPDRRLLAASRGVASGGPVTVVSSLTRDGRYTPLLTLPSGGDTSYPGMAWHDDRLWITYYSSHEDRTAIYLARVALA